MQGAGNGILRSVMPVASNSGVIDLCRAVQPVGCASLEVETVFRWAALGSWQIWKLGNRNAGWSFLMERDWVTWPTLRLRQIGS